MSASKKTVVEQLLDTAYKLVEEERDLYRRKGINRTTLRGMIDSGVVSEEDKALILELYPVQRRPRKNKPQQDEERQNDE